MFDAVFTQFSAKKSTYTYFNETILCQSNISYAVLQLNKSSLLLFVRNYSATSNKGKKSVKFLLVDGTLPGVVLTSV